MSTAVEAVIVLEEVTVIIIHDVLLAVRIGGLVGRLVLHPCFQSHGKERTRR
jgi:hypothetical protein